MTAFAIPSPVPAAPRVGFGRLAQFARDAYDRHRTRLALRHLDDHLMRDIGLAPREKDPVLKLLKAQQAQW